MTAAVCMASVCGRMLGISQQEVSKTESSSFDSIEIDVWTGPIAEQLEPADLCTLRAVSSGFKVCHERRRHVARPAEPFPPPSTVPRDSVGGRVPPRRSVALKRRPRAASRLARPRPAVSQWEAAVQLAEAARWLTASARPVSPVQSGLTATGSCLRDSATSPMCIAWCGASSVGRDIGVCIRA